ncbi:hypothetical protein TIFTF001_037912 [Ficus carica]|uniref:Uncharacterized protein n=1 Tax=Ficus carica TaxID=3494 RepID=A0AA88E7W3_FICCA|nr:hypothetical protein TIFTF001_037912 [Ficus carica]
MKNYEGTWMQASFTTQVPSNVATHRNTNLPFATFAVPSMGGSQSTTAFTPYSPLHPMASLPPAVAGVPPIRAFDLQKAIKEVVDKSVRGMERKLLQTLGHLATYEDLPDEVNQLLFNNVIAEIPNCHDTITLFALKKGLLPDSNFLNETCSRRPRIIAEALARAPGMIEVEELKKVTRIKITSPPERRNMDLYCEFHHDHGHLTGDCKVLRYEVAKLLKKGHLKEFLSEKGRRMYGLDKNDSRHDKCGPSHTPSPLLTKKIIGAFGGSILLVET